MKISTCLACFWFVLCNGDGAEEIDLSFLVRIEHLGGMCAGIIMNQYLIITIYDCVTIDGFSIATPPNIYVFREWGTEKIYIQHVARVDSPLNRSNNLSPIVYIQVTKPMNAVFYPPCQMIESQKFDLAFVAGFNAEEARGYKPLGEWVTQKNCHDNATEDIICFREYGGTIRPFQGGALFKTQLGRPQCIIGVTQDTELLEPKTAIRLDYWWEHIMLWFHEDAPNHWTRTTPIL